MKNTSLTASVFLFFPWFSLNNVYKKKLEYIKFLKINYLVFIKNSIIFKLNWNNKIVLIRGERYDTYFNDTVDNKYMFHINILLWSN